MSDQSDLMIQITERIEERDTSSLELWREIGYNRGATVRREGFFYCLNFDNLIVIIRVFKARLVNAKSLTATVASSVKQALLNRAFLLPHKRQKRRSQVCKPTAFLKGCSN